MLLRTFALVFIVLLLPIVAPAQDTPPEPAPLPQASGTAGATDQVEAWIRENLGDMREQGSDGSGQTVPDASGSPALSDTAISHPDVVHPAITGEPEAPAQTGGSLDWASGAMSFTAEEIITPDAVSPGRARAMALRGATLHARKALFQAVQDLALDGRRSVRSTLTPAEIAGVQAHLQNSRVQKREEMAPDGSTHVFVTASADLRGDMGDLLLPGAEPFLASVPDTIELTIGTVPTPKRDPKQAEYRTSMAELGGFTGLVVDARGLGAKPALLPVVADPSGLTAYGPFQVSRDDAVAKGLAIFTHDPDGPLLRTRAGKQPLVVRALAASGANRADLVISYEDAILVRTLFKDQDVKHHCRTVIILD